MDDFPRMLYRYPGSGREASKLQDGLYFTLIVYDEAAQAAAVGWFASSIEARASGDEALAAVAASAKAVADAKAIEDAKALLASVSTAPATRAEMDVKATELGIRFDGRTSDRKLADQIAAALED